MGGCVSSKGFPKGDPWEILRGGSGGSGKRHSNERRSALLRLGLRPHAAWVPEKKSRFLPGEETEGGKEGEKEKEKEKEKEIDLLALPQDQIGQVQLPLPKRKHCGLEHLEGVDKDSRRCKEEMEGWGSTIDRELEMLLEGEASPVRRVSFHQVQTVFVFNQRESPSSNASTAVVQTQPIHSPTRSRSSSLASSSFLSPLGLKRRGTASLQLCSPVL